MFAKTAIIVLVASVLLVGGCAVNRPYPSQDVVKNDILKKLVSMEDLNRALIYVEDTAYHYDMTNVLEVQKRILQKEDRRVTSRDVPQLLRPTAKEVRQSSRIIVAFKKYLDENKFRRVDVSCDDCLTAVVDYGQRHVKGEKIFFLIQRPGKTLFFPRVRLYFRGEEVAATRNDMGGWWEDTMSEPSDKIVNRAAEVLTDEMVQIWELRISTWRQQLGN